MKQRALISVYDKAGIVDFAAALVAEGWEIISTGGTLTALTKAGVLAVDISQVTGFPEILDGRVKTLAPQVHGGILARRDHPEDLETIALLGIGLIDLVVVNLYPFFEKVGETGLSHAQKIEFIDIGGPTMLRAAAKNYRDVAVVTDPADYPMVLQGIKAGELPVSQRKYLAGKVFNLTSAYDAAVSGFLLDEEFPPYYTIAYRKVTDLRYGENPHQRAAFYANAADKGALGEMTQLGGKELSYNNLKDLDIAWRLTSEFSEPFCAAVKHNTPCGAALGSTMLEAYLKAYRCDPVSIFGGIVACNRQVDAPLADELTKIFLEIVAAPSFTPEALEILTQKKNLRILQMDLPARESVQFTNVEGGLLVQTTDDQLFGEVKVVTKVDRYQEYQSDAEFGMKIVKYVKSNALVVVQNGATLGIGGGQVNRIWPTIDALKRAQELVDREQLGDLSKAVFVSDAFFPFDDCVEEAHRYQIPMIVQPGGSQNDQLSIDRCDANGICMVLTGVRHFTH